MAPCLIQMPPYSPVILFVVFNKIASVLLYNQLFGSALETDFETNAPSFKLSYNYTHLFSVKVPGPLV